MATKDRPRFRHALREMAENSTLHGLPKIVSAKQSYMKIIWTVVFIATTGYLTFHLYNLFENYFSWPIKTAVTLKYNPLRFPAVSFCNMNPIKWSNLNQTSEEVMSILNPALVKRNLSLAALTTDDYLLQNSTFDYGGINDQDFPDSLLNENYNFPDDVYPGPDYNGGPSGPADGYIYEPFDPYFHDFNTDHYNYDFSEQNTVPTFDLDAQLIKDLLAYDDQDAPREKWISRIEAFKHAFMNEPRAKREQLGHAIKDMLVSCSYNARKCFYNNFKLFQSSEYGNCFTLESSKYFSRKPGPLNGLWLTLNLEVLEYITSFVTGYGVKLLIHQPGTVVFPTVEGIVLSPGHETTIALRMVNVKRLGNPYGECSKGEEFQKAFGIQYTIPACIQLCKQHWVVKMCKCLPTSLEFSVNQNDKMDENQDNHIRECEIGNALDRRCQLKVESLYVKGSLDCSCGSPCEEVVYEKTISSRPWPNDKYLKYALVKNMCSNKNLTFIDEFCARYLNDSAKTDVTEARYNFLRTVIYYEDINYEVITESPLYDEFQFLANVGGTLGLFLGASALSAVEIIQLFIEIFIYLRGRIRHKLLKISDVKKIQVKPVHSKENEDATKV